MKFIARFVPVVVKGCDYSLDSVDFFEVRTIMESKPIGTELLGQLGVEAKQIDNSEISKFEEVIQLELDQSTAEKTGKFADKNTVSVLVSKSILQNFIEIVIKERRIEYVFNLWRLIDFWADNEFNLEILSEKDKGLLKEREQLREQKQREKDAAEALKKTIHEEKLEWINQHGSDYLKKCIKLDYNCQSAYVKERAALEFPGYIVDFDNEFEWCARVCPSQGALDKVLELIEKGYNAQIVWLEKYLTEYDGIWEYAKCEGIAIRGYLAKYDLVKPL